MSNIVRIDSTVELPSDPNAPGEYCVTPFSGTDTNLIAGVWSADPHTQHFDAYPVDEVCVVLTGSITLTELNAEPQIFSAGDAFGLRKGTNLTWTQAPETRKIFVILES